METDERTSSAEPAGVTASACTHRRLEATREAPAEIAACQPLGHALPALSQVRVRLTCLLLDRRPSLLTLRQRFSVFVPNDSSVLFRRVTPRDVHAGRAVIAFAHHPAASFGSRCLRGLPVLVHEAGLDKSQMQCGRTRKEDIFTNPVAQGRKVQ
jgi:hypothetical protein